MNHKFFKLGDVFSLSKPKNIRSQDVENPGPYPYVTRTQLNNGVASFVDAEGFDLNEGNTITIGGESAYAFYQADEFLAGNNITCLRSDKLNRLNAAYICTLINKNQYKYSYGRALNMNNVKVMEIPLPINIDGDINWDYMSSYIEELNFKPISSKNKSNELKLDIGEWTPFVYSDIFDITKGKRLTKMDMVPGIYNYIGAISDNNGVRDKIGNDEHINKGNCITINYNGSVGEAFYQKNDFWASDDVNIIDLKEREMNKYIGVFLCTLIKIERGRFSYGRKWKLDKMFNSIILLPSTTEGNPDWEYMESYIRLLQYGDRI